MNSYENKYYELFEKHMLLSKKYDNLEKEVHALYAKIESLNDTLAKKEKDLQDYYDIVDVLEA